MDMEMKTPQNYQHHFVAEETNVSGREFETTVFLENISASVGERLIALHFALRPVLQVLFDWISGQKVHRFDVAVATAGAHLGSPALHFDFQSVATAFGGRFGLIAQKVILVGIPGDAIEPTY